jgi:glycerol-3-phosphate acyltransferase PlsX
MGGDDAPGAPVAGAVRAARESGVPILLVGDRAAIEAELARHGKIPPQLATVHAGETIGMEESPATALLRKRDSSIMVAMNLLKEGKACGLVSAGNSGAVTGAAVVRLGMLPQVERPAIATVFPAQGLAGVVVLDAGATVDCDASNLVDFAYLGVTYARSLLSVATPRVALLSIGEEPTKGNAVVKKAHSLLAGSGLNFVGNIEGKDLSHGTADVVVCDGFVGNVLLKVTEGSVEMLWEMLRESIQASLRGRIGAWLIRPALRPVVRKLDYSTYGGALLVGVNGIVVIAHGRSSPAAIANALRVARNLAEHRVVEELTSSSALLRTRPLEPTVADTGAG